MNDYFYILINKKNKTAKMVKSEGCQAVTIDKLCKEYQKGYYEFMTEFSLIWNSQNSNFENMPKKYMKFKRV